MDTNDLHVRWAYCVCNTTQDAGAVDKAECELPGVPLKIYFDGSPIANETYDPAYSPAFQLM